MRSRYDEIRGRGAEVVAVGTGDQRYAEAFVKDEQVPFPVLLDDDGAAAQAAQVKVGSFIGMFSPKTWGDTVRTWKRGHRIHKSGKRVTQMGATFVIAPGDNVLYEHIDTDSTDHAPLDNVIAALP